uniref:Uncharacterized protein n=1 Tax=Arundo donax TaxID=35708 RepID=A0A0A8YNW8_ARUDO
MEEKETHFLSYLYADLLCIEIFLKECKINAVIDFSVSVKHGFVIGHSNCCLMHKSEKLTVRTEELEISLGVYKFMLCIYTVMFQLMY